MTPREELASRAVAWFAEHGVGDTSLRTLAAGIGTSHRMLNYHFGSREGLLGAVVEAVERAEQDALVDLFAATNDPVEAGARFWSQVADRAEIFAPLFFELSTDVMRRRPYAEQLRTWMTAGWTDALTEAFMRSGLNRAAARTLALQSLAMSRGLLFEVAVTGDREAADAAMSRWTEMVRTELAAAEHEGANPAGWPLHG